MWCSRDEEKCLLAVTESENDGSSGSSSSDDAVIKRVRLETTILKESGNRQARDKPDVSSQSAKQTGELNDEIRRQIWTYHQNNPKLKQRDLVTWARDQFNLKTLSQSGLSRILAKLRAESAKTGNLTNEHVRQIYEKYCESKLPQKDLAEWAKATFNLAKAPSQGTISNIVNRKRHIDDDLTHNDSNLKRKRIVRSQRFDEALVEWIIRCQENSVTLSWQMIQKKAQRFSKMLKIPEEQRISFSDGWLEKFLARYGLRNVECQGEAGSADIAAIESAMPELLKKIGQYELRDVFNMDETGLFYCMAPDRTIASRQIAGLKKNKTRMTIAFCGNADGSEKLEPFFIGHFLKPRCFQKKNGEQLGLLYRANSKGWMTGLLFQEWLRGVDRKMRLQQRRILLLLDNAPSHAIKNVDLTNVEVFFFPPNATSRLQPMDQGIIAAFKKRFRSLQLDHALDRFEIGESDIYKVDILRAMRWSKAAWDMISPATIQNCWRHSGLLQQLVGTETSGDAEDVDTALEEKIERLALRTPMALNELIEVEANQDQDQGALDDDLILEMVNIEECEPGEAGDGKGETAQSETPPVSYTYEEKVRGLGVSLDLLNDDPIRNSEAIRTLRRILHEVKSSEVHKKQQSLKQTKILNFFQK